MSLLKITALGLALGTSVSGSWTGPASCHNRVRDFYDRIDNIQRMRDLESSMLLTQPSGHKKAEMHYQVALAAWLADPIRYHRKCEDSLDAALKLNPLHLQARQLALKHAIRSVDRGDGYALAAAISHARELLAYPEIQRDPARLAKVSQMCFWLESKSHGRKALMFMAAMPFSAEQIPTQFLAQTQSLNREFSKALWEADDSAPELLEYLIGESVLDTLEKGLGLQAHRLTALLLLGQVDQAIEEYRRFLAMLTVGVDPGPEHDGTFLVLPVLELARRFVPFRENARLAEWSSHVTKVWAQGPDQTVDWMDLLLAGHLAPNPNDARGLWEFARHSFRLSKQANSPESESAAKLVLHHFASLLE